MEWMTECTQTARVLLFDMDGTLVDSTGIVEQVWRRFAERHGLEPETLMATLHGRQARDTIAALALPGVDVEAEAARLTAEEVAQTEGIVPLAGAAQLLATLPDDSWALVTSAGRELATVRLTAAGLPLPRVMITAERVSQGKPDPEGYLLAARELGAAPSDCIVFEDAEVGLAAAQAAGMRVIALPTTLPPERLARECRIRDYRDLSVRAAHGVLQLTGMQPGVA